MCNSDADEVLWGHTETYEFTKDGLGKTGGRIQSGWQNEDDSEKALQINRNIFHHKYHVFFFP